jgi:hypothetical protein
MSVLVAVAIAGIIAATLATLYENMTALMLRSNVSAEVDNLQRYLQGVLSQRELCQHAMRDAVDTAVTPGNKIVFPMTDSARVNVPVIQIRNDAMANGVLALQTNSALTPQLTIASIELWEPGCEQQ